MSRIEEKPKVKRFRIADLELADYNPRSISDEAKQGLRESLEAFGLIDIPVVNIKDKRNRVVGGHQRILTLIEEGYTHVDCVEVELDDTDEVMANITLNNPHTQGRWDVKAAMPVLEKIDPKTIGMGELRKQILRQAGKDEDGNDKAPSGKDYKPKKKDNIVSALGEVYVLGEHRVLCGDGLTGLGELLEHAADCTVMDPPYNVDYMGDAIENDKMSEDQWLMFMRQMCRTVMDLTEGPCYIFMASKTMPTLDRIWREEGGVVHRILFWLKDKIRPTLFGFRNTEFYWMHEPLLYGWRDGADPPAPTKARTNALRFPKPDKNKLHPAQKPVDMLQGLIEDGTEEGDIVLDPFAGSGSVLMACQASGRICVCSEIDPGHVDTIRQRWAEAVYGEDCDWEAKTPTA